jgi:MFS family permease
VRENRNFMLYAAGRLVSLVGTGVQDVAIPLFILDLTGSGTLMGTFMILSMVPRLLLYPIAGVVGDRVNRKWIMVWTDFGRGALILLLALLATRDLVGIPVLYVAQLLMSAMSALFGPATMAMLPDIVDDDELTRANSVMGGIDSGSMIVGPVLGGIIYGIGGITGAFLVNGISFIVSGASEVFIRYHQETTKVGSVREVLRDLRGGLRFARESRALMTLIGFALVINAFLVPLFAVHLPYMMRVVIGFSARDFGFVSAAFMAGILGGNLLIATLFASSRIEKLLNRGLFATTLFMFALVALMFPDSLATLGYASLATLAAYFSVLVVLGLFNAFINTPLNVGLQRLAPTEFRARVFSVLGLGTQAVTPIGFAIMGIALDLYPAHLIALAVTLMGLVIVATFILRYSKIVSDGLSGGRA